jgi:hypothetical protein
MFRHIYPVSIRERNCFQRFLFYVRGVNENLGNCSLQRKCSSAKGKDPQIPVNNSDKYLTTRILRIAGTYIAASYVKWIEAAGGRVVPLIAGSNQNFTQVKQFLPFLYYLVLILKLPWRKKREARTNGNSQIIKMKKTSVYRYRHVTKDIYRCLTNLLSYVHTLLPVEVA